MQIFDSWAGVLGHSQFCEFSLAYLTKIVSKIRQKIPVILFCKGASVFAGDLVHANPHAISIDWNARLSNMRPLIPSSIALQGNLDPDLLYAPLSKLREEVKHLLHSMQGDQGYIFNLGHGITPETPVEAVRELVACVKGTL